MENSNYESQILIKIYKLNIKLQIKYGKHWKTIENVGYRNQLTNPMLQFIYK